MPFSSSKTMEMGQLYAAPYSLASPSHRDGLESSARSLSISSFLFGWQMEAVSPWCWFHCELTAPLCQGTMVRRWGHSAGRGRLPRRHHRPAPPRSRPLPKLSFTQGSFCYKWCLHSHRKDNEVIALKAFSTIFFKEKIHLRSFYS